MPRTNGKNRLYGQLAIERAALEPVPNPNPERDYLIACWMAEFTCLCPRSGFPDFATIRLRYVPDASIVELKSLKLYLNRFRDEHAFHEAVINRIADDLERAIEPRWLELVGDFNVRGNIKTIITVVRQREGYRLPDYLRDQLFSTTTSPSAVTL
ncbi:MAG TPA: preQ(1) synthase [Chloroflexota bacterium]|jgi:7-cyano-7-deazaguanine reductase